MSADPNGGAFARNADWDAIGGWSTVADASGDPNDVLFGHVVAETSLSEASGFDAVLVGEPYDGAVIGRRGAREGPTAIRESLARAKAHHYDAGPVGSIGDLGDVAALLDAGTPADGDSGDEVGIGGDESVLSVQDRVREVAAAVHEVDALPVFLGGDNSLTYPNVAPLLGEGSIGVVNLDAHLDVREVRDDATSGTPYRQLFEAGVDAYACVGARHFETSTTYHEFVDDRGGEVVTAEEVGEDPIEAARLALEATAGVDRLYVSVDCDVLDASAAPGVSAPTPGGITTRELFRLLRVLASDDRLAGVEVVECAPPLDRDGRTADAAARAVAHVLAGHGVGR